MTIDFEAQAHLADLRIRVLSLADLQRRKDHGEALTPTELEHLSQGIAPNEYRELLLNLQQGRDRAAAASASQRQAAAKTKRQAAKPPIDIAKLFENVAGRLSNDEC